MERQYSPFIEERLIRSYRRMGLSRNVRICSFRPCRGTPSPRNGPRRIGSNGAFPSSTRIPTRETSCGKGGLIATLSAWFLAFSSLLLPRGAGPRGGTNDDGSVASPAIQSGSTHRNASISHHHNPRSQAGHLRQGRPSPPS